MNQEEDRDRGQAAAASRPPRLLLERLASECLEHTKQLGLFDQLRMRLLDSILSSQEFQRAKSDFGRELDEFCSQVDLSQTRSQLRQRMTAKLMPKSASRLRELVLDKLVSSRRQRREMRQLYERQALQFIRQACQPKPVGEPASVIKPPLNKQQSEPSNKTTTTTKKKNPKDQDQDDDKRPSKIEPLEAAAKDADCEPADSLATDSGLSSSGGLSSCSPPLGEPALTCPATPPPKAAKPGGGGGKGGFLRDYHIPRLAKPRLAREEPARDEPPPVACGSSAAAAAASREQPLRRAGRKKKKNKKNRRRGWPRERRSHQAATTTSTTNLKPAAIKAD